MIDYDPDDWDSHLFDIKGSMVREILGRVLTCVAWSVVVVLLYQVPFLKWMAIPTSVHSLVGFALGLLLVFRTNAAYDRFWEGRKLWGSITNECRNLCGSASVLLRQDPDRMRLAMRWTQVFPFSLKARLKMTSDLGKAAKHLPSDQVASVLHAPVPPLVAAKHITEALVGARDQGIINSYEFINIDNNVQLLIDYAGGCERIHNTPLPFPYMVHLRALILYCFTLPFALVREFGWGTVLDTLGVAYLFFGIEEIGVEIGDPFGDDDNDLPIERYCEGIESTIETLIPAADVSELDDSPVLTPPAADQSPIPLD